MAMIHDKKRFSFSRNTVEVPFHQAIKDFMEESYKCQVLFANCEGYYQRRVGKRKDEAMLKDFIYNTMYYNEDQDRTSQSELKKMSHVSQICEKIILMSQQYDLGDEVHFSVVWIYYFDYNTRIKEAIPVFKIFKKRSSNEAVFLDIFLNSYENWNCYLETAEYPESFLCVPRHGAYRFEDGVLLLEFVRSMKLKTKDNKYQFKALPFPLAPFSQTVVRPLLDKVVSFATEKMEQIMQLLRTLFSYWKELKLPILNSALFVFLLEIKMKAQNELDLISSKVIPNLALMLLNTVVESEDPSNLLDRNFRSESTMTSISGFLSFSGSRTAVKKIFEESTHFLELLKSDKKDWFEIMKSFCSLFQQNSFILKEILNTVLGDRILLVLYLLLIVLEKIIIGGNSLSTSELSFNNEKVMIPSSAITENQIQQLTSSSAETEKVLNKILLNLPLLYTTATDKIINRLFEESADEVAEKLCQGTGNILVKCPYILIGKQNGYGIYLFPEASLSRLALIFHGLLKTDFYFKPEGVTRVTVIDGFGKTFGHIFFPLEYSAVGLFPFEAFGKDGAEQPYLAPKVWN